MSSRVILDENGNPIRNQDILDSLDALPPTTDVQEIIRRERLRQQAEGGPTPEERFREDLYDGSSTREINTQQWLQGPGALPQEEPKKYKHPEQVVQARIDELAQSSIDPSEREKSDLPYGMNFIRSSALNESPEEAAARLGGAALNDGSVVYSPNWGEETGHKAVKSVISLMDEWGMTDDQIARRLSASFAPGDWIPFFYESRSGKSWFDYDPTKNMYDSQFKVGSQVLLRDALLPLIGVDSRKKISNDGPYDGKTYPFVPRRTGEDGITRIEQSLSDEDFSLGTSEEQEKLISEAIGMSIFETYSKENTPPSFPKPSDLMLQSGEDGPPPPPMQKMLRKGVANPLLWVNPVDGETHRWGNEETVARAEEIQDENIADYEVRVEKYNNLISQLNADIEKYELDFKQYEEAVGVWNNGLDAFSAKFNDKVSSDHYDYLRNFYDVALMGGIQFDRFLDFTEMGDEDPLDPANWQDERLLRAYGNYIPLDFAGDQEAFEAIKKEISNIDDSPYLSDKGEKGIDNVDIELALDEIRQAFPSASKIGPMGGRGWMNEDAEQQAFKWVTRNGKLTSRGDLLPADIGIDKFLEISQEELLDKYNQDPAYVEYIDEKMFAYDASPRDVIDREKRANPGKNHDELMESSDRYKAGFQELERRRNKYALYYRSVWLRDYIFENTLSLNGERNDIVATQSQLAWMERYILDEYGLMVPLSADNMIGPDRAGIALEGMASYGQGSLGLVEGLGGIIEWTGDLVGSRDMRLFGNALAGTSADLAQGVEEAKAQWFFDRQMYEDFGQKSIYNNFLDDLTSDAGYWNNIKSFVGLGDDFSRQEWNQDLKSAPLMVTGAAITAATGGFGAMGMGGGAAIATGAGTRWALTSAARNALVAFGKLQMSQALVNGVVTFGQKYDDVRLNPAYQIYTTADGKNLSYEEAEAQLAAAKSAGSGNETYEDLGISVDQDFGKAWGAASVHSAAETIPEYVGGWVTKSLAGMKGPGAISEMYAKRMVQYVLGYAATTGISMTEEGATEWVTSMSQDYADSIFEGKPFNVDASLEKARMAWHAGQRMSIMFGGSISAISTVQTERNILKNIENDPTWIKQENLRASFANQYTKLSKDGKKKFDQLQELRREAQDPNISESYREGLEKEITDLEAEIQESDARAYEVADKLLKNNVGLAEKIRATYQVQLMTESLIQQAIDNDAPQGRIDVLIEQQMLLQDKMDTYMNAATLAIEEKTWATVRDGSNAQTETEVTSRPATKAEADMVMGDARPVQDEETESQQNEAEQNVQEYDDDLDRIVREEEDYMVINGVDENGSAIYEGQNEDNTEFTGKFQEGVVDLLKALNEVIGNQTSAVLYGTTEAFNQDPNVQAYVAEHGKKPAALAVFGPDGTVIEKILVSPETTRQQAIHEAAHASMREILNDPAARTDMTQKILDLADQKGNRRFRAWVNSLVFDYASPEARERRKNGGKLTADQLTPMEQEELIVEFQAATATNDWVVTGGRAMELSKTALQRLESGFWNAMSALSPTAKNLNFKKNTSLAELTERFKRAMPPADATRQKAPSQKSSGPNVVVPNTEQEIKEKVNTPNENKATVGKPTPQTNPGGASVVVPEHTGHVSDSQGVRASSDAINTSKSAPVTEPSGQTLPSGWFDEGKAPSEKADAPVAKMPQEPSPRRPEESDQEYRERLEQEANQLLEGMADIETPETDALSQETDQIDGTSVAALERGRQDFISGKKVTGVYYNGYGYPRTFQMTPNDYFHFRNWHNKITGNGAQPFAKLFYTTENGEVKTLRTPKPKLDKQGNPVVMKPVDIRTALRKFGDARIALVQAKSTMINERTNRLNRVLEIAKENGITYDQLGLKGPYPGSNTYAEVEQAEVVIQAMLNPSPGTAYPMGLVSPKVEDWQMLTPKTLEDLRNGKKRGYGALDRRGKRGGSDRVNFVRDYGFGTMMQDRDGGMRPALSTAKNFDEARAAVVTNYNIGDARMPLVTVNYAPTEVGTASFTWTPRGETEAQTVNFKVPGGIMRPVVDALDYKRRNGREGGAVELVGPTFTSKAARNAVENHFQNAREAIDQNVQGISDTGIVLVKMLATDNPYGDPLVFEGIIGVMDAIITQDPQALPVVVQELNKILLKSKMGSNNPLITKTQEGMEAIERGDVALDEEGRFRGQVYTFQGAVDNLKMNPDQMASSGFKLVTREGGKGDMALAIDENNMEAGWNSFKNLLANAKTDTNLGFSARKPIMDDLLKAMEKGKNAEIGFPTRDEVKAMVNLHGLDEGGIAETSEQKFVGMYVMDINAMRKMELDPKNRSYTIGLSGFQELIMFEEPMTQEEFEAKPRTTVVGGGGKSFTSGTRALASLKRGGNVTFKGMETWEKSHHGGFASALAAIGVKLTDKYRDVNLLQKDIEAFNKARVNASEDFIMAVDLMYGRTAARLEGLEEVQGLLQDRMKASGITSDMLSDYLYAKHAVERNIQIHKNNPDNFTGSGQTNEWADETIEKLKSKEMDALANMVYSVIENTRKTMVEYGLETQERIDAWNDMYEFYVPLAGIATDEKNEHSIAYPNGGAGMAVYGNTIKRAKGRRSEVKTNIVAQVIMQNAMTIQMAEKNKAIRTLFELALNNPNENVWAIVDGKNPLTALDDSGRPRAMTVAEMKLNPHTVPVRIDGEQKFIYFKDAHYANTLNGMTVERAKFFARAVGNVTGWMRGVFTIYDPSFFLSNFARDLQSAIPNAIAETERTDGYVEGLDPYKFTGQVIKNIPKALTSLLKYQAFGLTMDPMVEKYLDEMKNAGGMTGWGMTKDLNQIMTELEKASRLGADQAAQEFDAVMGSPKKFLKYIEGINDAFEQATRLGAYMTARQNGVSIQKAAQLAKNVTVNFNRGGEWQFLSSVYLFFNASVQGSARIFRSLFYLKDARKANGELDSWYKRITLPQKIAFAFTTFSGLVTMMNLAVSGRDEDGDEELWYNKISDYEKERNLIIMHSNGKSYTKIPLPYGYNIFNNLGVAAVETSTGNRDMWSATGFVANSFVSSFSPISFGQSKDLSKYAMKAAAPTVLKPFVDVAVNESYFGTQIYQERFPFSTTPNSELSFRSPEVVEDFFKWMNKASGGSEYSSGEYDYNPDAAWYILEYFMGGSGKFVTQSGELFNNVREMVRTGEKIDLSPNDIPVVKKVYGEPGKYYDFDLFRERSFEVQQLYREAENAPVFEKDRYEGIYALNDMLKTTTDILELLRAQRRNAREIYTNPTERANAIADIEERERAAMARFNKYYEKIRGEE